MGKAQAVFDAASITPEWLTAVLTEAGALAADETIVAIDREDIGTGQVGSNIRYRLHYGGPTPASGAPLESIVVKLAAEDETSRGAGIATKTYETEVAFYRDVADSVEISRPACYFAEIVTGTADVVLVLEDLHPAVPGDQLAGCTVAQAELAVDQAVRLHGPRWDDPTLLDHEWLAAALGAQSRAGVGELYAMVWDGFLARYSTTLSAEAVGVGTRLRETIVGWATYDPAARTLTHGDYRLDNMLFGTAEGGRPLTVVDWQTVRLGCGTSDVAYFLGAGLDPEQRRAHEHDLVTRYHQGLQGYGVDDYSFDACWEDYRRYSFGGLVMAVIASMLVRRTDRGDEMFMVMANRHAAQAVDLNAEELL
jgi:hypothetical protein